MNNFIRFTIGLSAAVFMGTAWSQSAVTSAGHHVKRLSGPNVQMRSRAGHDAMTIKRPQRRFLMPATRTGMDSRGIQTYRTGVDNMGRRNSRMSADERRALRRQINEANQGIYMRPRRHSSTGF
jgi:hypothetical protein